MKYSKKNYIVYLGIILILLNFFLSLLNYNNFSLSVDNEYSYILDDLQKDDSFKIEDFPAKDEYSLQIIQIAESENGELFIYVYQPLVNKSDLLATRISLSQNNVDDENVNFQFYYLKYLNSSETLFKYKVENIQILQDEVRCYNINSIYRQYDEDLDEELENGNKVVEVPYQVSMKWTVYMEDEKLVYSSIGTEVVTITDKYVGFVRYKDGFNLHPTSCDSYFVAFACDKPIDRLISADVYYVSQMYDYYDFFAGDEHYNFGVAEENYKTVNYTDKVQFDGSVGIFKHKFKWNRIQTVDEFLTNEEVSKNLNLGVINYGVTQKLSSEVSQYVENMQWVLRFAETDYSVTVHTGSAKYYVTKGTIIENVSLLRLMFEYDGKVYNLGVIDGIHSPGDYIPDNEVVETVKPSSFVLKLLGYVLVAFILIMSVIFIFKIICSDNEIWDKIIEIILILCLACIFIFLIFVYLL